MKSVCIRAAAPIFSVGLCLTAAQAQITVSEERISAFDALEKSTGVTFEPLPAVEANNVVPQLINGTPVNPKFFPAVFRMTTGGTCTATVVGPAAVLLAAHCVDHLSRIAFVAGGTTIAGICEHAPGYISVDKSEDWAMCLLEREIGGMPYESVDLDALPTSGETLLLTGYGCIREDGGLDGVLRIGVSQVTGRPQNWPDESSTIYTTSDLSAGEAVLCPGDSGGPLYRLSGEIDGAREIVGVNSRTTYEHGISLFSATASPAGAAFLRNWTDRHDQNVCGIDLVEGCR